MPNDPDYSKSWHHLYVGESRKVDTVRILGDTKRFILYEWWPNKPKERNFFIQRRDGSHVASCWSKEGLYKILDDLREDYERNND